MEGQKASKMNSEFSKRIDQILRAEKEATRRSLGGGGVGKGSFMVKYPPPGPQ